MISGALLLLSLGSLLIGGLELSIDFVGGTSYRVAEVADTEVTAEQLRDAAGEAGADEVTAQLQIDGDRTTGAIVRTEAIEAGSDQAIAIEQALAEAADADDVTTSFVGPTWGESITLQAVQALVVFLVVVVIYISLRLELKMAIAGVVALLHDLTITIGLYALLGFSVSPSTVIALLTIMGYSLYDTVIILDRIKDNTAMLGEPGWRTYSQVVDNSVGEVLMRSINTSITSLLPVAALLFIGAGVLGATTLQDLALALFIGMADGIYSSLFVATPIVAAWKEREPENAKLAERARILSSSGSGAGADAGTDSERDGDERDGEPADQAEVPASRAPVTTEYVRGEGKRKRRRR